MSKRDGGKRVEGVEDKNGETLAPAEAYSIGSLLDSTEVNPESAADRLEEFPEGEVFTYAQNEALSRGAQIRSELNIGQQLVNKRAAGEGIGLEYHSGADGILQRANEVVERFEKDAMDNTPANTAPEARDLPVEERTRRNMKEFLLTAEGKKMMGELKNIFLEEDEGEVCKMKDDLIIRHFEHFKKIMEVMTRSFKDTYKSESSSGMPTEILWEVFGEDLIMQYTDKLRGLNNDDHKDGYFNQVGKGGIGGDFYRANEGMVGQIDTMNGYYFGDVASHGEKVAPMAFLVDKFLETCEKNGIKNVFMEMDKFLHNLKIKDKAVGLGKVSVERGQETAQVNVALTNSMKVVCRYKQGDHYVMKCMNFEGGNAAGSGGKDDVYTALEPKKTPALSTGVVEKKGSDAELEVTIEVPLGAEVYIYTDGFFEVEVGEDDDGVLFGDIFEDFSRNNKQLSNDEFFRLALDTHRKYHENTREGVKDDVTVLRIKV